MTRFRSRHGLAGMTSSQEGFTLLELVIVIAITGILSTVAVVQFNGAKKTAAVRQAAENFAAFVRTTENMSRVGMPLPSGQGIDCNGDGNPEQTPCGGYGVVVTPSQYYRFGDNVNVLQRAADSGDPQGEVVKLPDNVTIMAARAPITVLFVPPKDTLCIRNDFDMKCGPREDRTVVFTFGYAGISYAQSVRVNTVSGLVSVE